MSAPSPHTEPRGSGDERFPRVIRLRHFIVLPAVTMAAAILVSRAIQTLLVDRLGPAANEVFVVSRPILISLVMASLIAWLAVRYRRPYELELRDRNKELEETRDFLSSIVRDSAEAIVTLDAADRITSWNRGAERIFGWRSDEVVGQSVERVLPDDETILEERRQVGELLRAGETVRDHETTRVRKGGKMITVRISWSPLQDASGRVVGVTGIVLDVTAEREMRERLVERERLAAVGEMAARVAHEIRNPLAGIRGACEILFAKNESAVQERDVGKEVLHQIDRLNTTVNELLRFSSSPALHKAATDLNELIDRVVSLFREDPSSRKVRIERRYGHGLTAIEVDPGQFEQVFYNLLLNAGQAMGYEGSISVATSLRDGHVDIRVRDTGPGLPASSGDELFKPFYTTRTEGTGLGLAIVKKIVLAHGGTVRAKNAAGGGAEFRIRLPAPARGTAGVRDTG